MLPACWKNNRLEKSVIQIQGRGEGVKGMTISRGPDVKRGPGNLENKRKIGYSNVILLFWAPNP
jgi:hypothetical protein